MRLLLLGVVCLYMMQRDAQQRWPPTLLHFIICYYIYCTCPNV